MFRSDTAIAKNRSTITGRGKKHGKTCRNQELRKNSSCKTGEQATLTLDDECNVFFNFRRIYLIAFRQDYEFTPASQVQARPSSTNPISPVYKNNNKNLNSVL
ncbi:MAG: hypothetical protein ACTSRA_21200 [Promethearchaeota archaeon]